jgi:predicted DNA binding CopG/RHH family protein
MAKPRNKVPVFKTEAEEREFWESHDSSDYLDWSQAKAVRLPNLKASTKTISQRLPVALLERIKLQANKRDIPYQSLIKAWLSEDVDGHRSLSSPSQFPSGAVHSRLQCCA